jgi:hypothetical protein
MRKFIIKISILLAICFSIIAFIIDAKINLLRDVNYSKYLSKHKSLIIGTSRSNFAIDPSSFSEKYDLFNFAFTAATSPFGKIYYEAIQDKITKEKGAIFLIGIDPYGLSLDKKEPIFTEEKNSLGRQFTINVNPNYEYIFKNNTPLYDRMFPAAKSNKIKHENGFTQLKDNLSEERKIEVRKIKILEYTGSSHNDTISAERLGYLEKTIEFLQQYGNVYLISVPVSPELFAIQEKYWPQRYQYIEGLKKKYKIQYINMQINFPNPKTIDYVHLELEQSKVVSDFLSRKIDSLEASFAHTHITSSPK